MTQLEQVEREQLVMELPDFEVWLHDNAHISETTIHLYSVNAVKPFLLKTKSIDEPDAYAKEIVERCIRKRNIWVWTSLMHYVNYKFQGSKNRDIRESILNTMKAVKPKVPTTNLKTPVILDDNQINDVLKNMPTRWSRVVCAIQIETGIRFGDVMRIKRGEIRWEPFRDKVVLSIGVNGKGDKHYKVWVFNQEIQTIIMDYITTERIDSEYYFFPPIKSGLLTRLRSANRRYNLNMKKALIRCGIRPKDWASHDFRRNIARKVWERYHDLMLVKEVLHHTEISTSLRYLSQMGLQVQEVFNDLHEEQNGGVNDEQK